MVRLFKDERFYRIFWFDPASHSLELDDPKRLAQMAQDLHGNVVHYVATLPNTGETFYNSKIRKKAAFCGNRDLLQEMIEECHKRNIKLVAYFNCHWVPIDQLPEDIIWACTFKNGKIFNMKEVYGASGTCPCSNSPEYLKLTIDTMKEICAYDVDGIFFDGPAIPPGTCYCKNCIKLFKEKTGYNMMDDEKFDTRQTNQLVAFRYQSIMDYMSAIRKEVQKVRDIPFYKNSAPLRAALSYSSPEVQPMIADMIGGEHFVFYSDPINTECWRGGATAKYMRSIGKEKPCVVFMSYPDRPWDYYTIPDHDMGQIIADVAANGAYPFVTIDDYVLINDDSNYKSIKELFGFIEKNEQLYYAESNQEVAIYWSQRSADIYSRGRIKGASGTHHFEVESEKEYAREFDGFCDALVLENIPYDIIAETNLTKDELAKYRVLIMPNCACISRKQEDLIREFVKEGGVLIATNEFSLYDEQGIPRNEFLLADVIGASLDLSEGETADSCIHKSRWDYQIIEKEHPVTANMKGRFIPQPSLSIKVKPRNKDEVLAMLMNPLIFRYNRLQGNSPYPSIIAREFGKGKVIYFTGIIGHLHYKYGIRHARQLIVNSVKWAYDVPVRLEGKGKMSIEISVGKLDSKRIIHLINWASKPRLRPVEELIPLYNINIHVKDKRRAKKATALWNNKNLDFKQNGDWINLTLPELGRYEVVVIDY